MLKRQFEPLTATADAMVALSSENQIPKLLPVCGQDEIGQLSCGFNRLIGTWVQREGALRKSEQNLAITLNPIGDAVIATDPQGRITSVNPAAECLCGWPLAEATGRPLSEVFCIVNASTREAVADPVQFVMAHGRMVELANHTLLLARIRLALVRGELVLHFHPEVNMRTGQVIGAEALIRWQHPGKGLLAPASFLPVIEVHLLAVQVGESVIDTALTQIEVWRAGGLEVLETSALADMTQVSKVI